MVQIHGGQIIVCLLNHLEQLFTSCDLLASSSLKVLNDLELSLIVSIYH